MNPGITRRRSFLNERKAAGHRITIGFTGIADFRSNMGQEYIAGIMKAAADYDLNFINFSGAIKYSLFEDMDFFSHFVQKFRFFKQPLIDGLVTWGSSLGWYQNPEKTISMFSSLRPLPIVDLGYLDIPGVPSVRINDAHSISLMMNHLCGIHKYTKFAFIGNRSNEPHNKRLAQFREELAKNSLPEIENSICMGTTMDNAEIAHCVEQLCNTFDLHAHKGLDAIVTPSDGIASSVITELERRGIYVPQDVAVTGFNNQFSGMNAAAPVTTINLEYSRRAYAAVELLIDEIINPGAKNEFTLIEPSLIVRQSCGCFEESIVEAGTYKFPLTSAAPGPNAPEADVRLHFRKQFDIIFPNQTEETKQSLVDAVISDIYVKPQSSSILSWFQHLMQQNKLLGFTDDEQIQHSVTCLRSVIMQCTAGDEAQSTHLENIFQQLRVFISMQMKYGTTSRHDDSYQLNSIATTALSFSSKLTGMQVHDMLRYELGKMEIPGMVLALNDKMSTDIGSAAIDMVLPEPPDDIAQKLPYRVNDPSVFPKIFFPSTHRYSAVLEILYYQDKYLGYAFFEMSSMNIALYDAVRALLSHLLFTLYTSEGRTSDHTSLLSDKELDDILHLPAEDSSNGGGMTAHQITHYIIAHVNEMTDVNKMAEDLNVSRSTLERQTKKLTGYSVQNLHEKIKIEQEKIYLQVKSLKLKEIAQLLGFQHQYYFSAVFKKNTGVSPRLWSRQQ